MIDKLLTMKLTTVLILLCTHIIIAGITLYIYSRPRPSGVLTHALIVVNDEADIENVDLRNSTVIFNPDIETATLGNDEFGDIMLGNKSIYSLDELNKDVIDSRKKRFHWNSTEDL